MLTNLAGTSLKMVVYYGNLVEKEGRAVDYTQMIDRLKKAGISFKTWNVQG